VGVYYHGIMAPLWFGHRYEATGLFVSTPMFFSFHVHGHHQPSCLDFVLPSQLTISYGSNQPLYPIKRLTFDEIRPTQGPYGSRLAQFANIIIAKYILIIWMVSNPCMLIAHKRKLSNNLWLYQWLRLTYSFLLFLFFLLQSWFEMMWLWILNSRPEAFCVVTGMSYPVSGRPTHPLCLPVFCWTKRICGMAFPMWSSIQRWHNTLTVFWICVCVPYSWSADNNNDHWLFCIGCYFINCVLYHDIFK